MAGSELYYTVLTRLCAESDALGDVATVVEAAMGDDATLAAALKTPTPLAVQAPAAQAAHLLRGTWLTRLEVQGFRGIGGTAAIEFEPTPGLVLVTGRNGSGKSSLAEGLEVLLTGDSARFRGRSADWREGWRNLGGAQPAVRATFAVEGEGEVKVERAWQGDGGLASGTCQVTRAGGVTDLAGIGWAGDLEAFRPVLATTELARMHDGGPAASYDALKGILGLDEMVAALGRMAAAKKEAKRVSDSAKDDATELKEMAEAVADPRAETLRRLLKPRAPNVDDVALLVAGETAEDPQLAELRALVKRDVPDLAAAAAASAALRAAVADAAALTTAAGEIDRRASEVLDAALSWHDAHGDGDCPACGTAGVLHADWRARAIQTRDDRRAATQHQAEARSRQLAAERGARAYVPDSQLGGDALADHLDAELPGRVAGLVAEQEAARATLLAREDRWRPLALKAAAWVERAQAAASAKERQTRLEKAEKWLKALSDELREERFRPLGAQSQATWAKLRQQSSVELVDVALKGSGTARKVDLKVNVDGKESVALSVMSQGELNALAIALFLPRAMLPASPFRFAVIDDPVQSMDPGKVDGLAEVLKEAAETRQVIVFTHDPRLPEAVRRLQIPARVLEVSRRGGSVLEVRQVKHPVEQYLRDAEDVARSNGLGERVGRRIVPGLCRSAVEATLQAHVRRKRLGRGDRHEDVEAAIQHAQKVHTLAALALFDDPELGVKVLPELNRISREAADAFQALKHGSHQPHDGDLYKLVSGTRALITGLPRLLA